MKLVVSLSQDKFKLQQAQQPKQTLMTLLDEQNNSYFSIQKSQSNKFIGYHNQQKLKNIKHNLINDQSTKRVSLQVLPSFYNKQGALNTKNNVKSLYYAFQPEELREKFERLTLKNSIELKNSKLLSHRTNQAELKLPKIAHNRQFSHDLTTTIDVQDQSKINQNHVKFADQSKLNTKRNEQSTKILTNHPLPQPNENFEKLKEMLRIKKELKVNQRELRKLKNSYNSMTADDVRTTTMDKYEQTTSINEIINRINMGASSPLEQYSPNQAKLKLVHNSLSDQTSILQNNEKDLFKIQNQSLEFSESDYNSMLSSKSINGLNKNQLTPALKSTIDLCKQVRKNLQDFYKESQSTALRRAQQSLEKIRHEKEKIKTNEVDGAENKFKYGFSKKFFQQVKEGQFFNSIRLLLKNEDLVNEQDGFDYTALHWAAKRGHLNLCELLLTFESDPNKKDIFGRTPIDHAKIQGYQDVLEYLQKYQNIAFEGDKMKFKDMYQIALLNNPKEIEM